MSERVLLGFSGGIDSVTSVRLLKERGYDVVTLTLDMVGDEQLLRRASLRASELGVEHHILDVREAFRRHVVDYFTSSYLSGHTPAPCTVCNPAIKWRFMADYADRLGIEHIASGHYFKVVHRNDKYYVARAADSSKDQSYYLWGLDQRTLSRIVTPMGDAIKQQVKADFEDKRESMGVCFLQGQLYRDFIISHSPSAAAKGDVVDAEGRVVGKHDGIAFYTVGQKRGFECSLAGAVVVDVDAEHNRLVVGSNNDLYKQTIDISDCVVVDSEELFTADDISVVVRGLGRNPEGFLQHVEPLADGYRLHLSTPAWALALGQPVVLYRGECVLGGGFIVARS